MGGDGRGWDEVVCLCESLHHTLEPESSFFLRTPFFVCVKNYFVQKLLSQLSVFEKADERMCD